MAMTAHASCCESETHHEPDPDAQDQVALNNDKLARIYSRVGIWDLQGQR